MVADLIKFSTPCLSKITAEPVNFRELLKHQKGSTISQTINLTGPSHSRQKCLKQAKLPRNRVAKVMQQASTTRGRHIAHPRIDIQHLSRELPSIKFLTSQSWRKKKTPGSRSKSIKGKINSKHLSRRKK